VLILVAQQRASRAAGEEQSGPASKRFDMPPAFNVRWQQGHELNQEPRLPTNPFHERRWRSRRCSADRLRQPVGVLRDASARSKRDGRTDIRRNGRSWCSLVGCSWTCCDHSIGLSATAVKDGSFTTYRLPLGKVVRAERASAIDDIKCSQRAVRWWEHWPTSNGMSAARRHACICRWGRVSALGRVLRGGRRRARLAVRQRRHVPGAQPASPPCCSQV
jgi:hypothetical protein